MKNIYWFGVLALVLAVPLVVAITFNEDLIVDSTNYDFFVQDSTGKVGIATSSPGERFQVGTTSSGRFATIDSVGRGTFRLDDNSAADVLNLANVGVTGADHGANLRFLLGDGTNLIAGGYVKLLSEQDWTSTASTQDSKMGLFTAKDGATTEWLRIDSNGKVFMGRLDGYRGTPDFEWDNPNQKLKVRAMILGDIGDATEIALRRAGPDNAAYDASPQPLNASVNVAPIYWQPYGTNGDFESSSSTGRIAQIYARTAVIPTGTNRAGTLVFATTSVNQESPTDRIVIDEAGGVTINGLTGSGNDYACLDSTGKLFRSNTAC